MIAIGGAAPTFVGTTASGEKFDLASLWGRPFVLYFYPKANTTGCSIEARGFAEHYPELTKAGLEVIGVSVDSVEDQKDFAEKCGVPFRLIADRDRSIAKLYGVLSVFGVAKRVTFFVGADGRVQDVVQGMLPGPHLARATEWGRKSSAPASPPRTEP